MPFKNQRSPSAPIVYGGVSIDPKSGEVSAGHISADTLSIMGSSFDEIMADLEKRTPGAVFWRHRIHGAMEFTTAASITVFKRPITFVGGRVYTVSITPIMYQLRTAGSSGAFTHIKIIPDETNESYYDAQHYLYAADRNSRGATLTDGATMPVMLPVDAGIRKGYIQVSFFGPTNGSEWRVMTNYNQPEVRVKDDGPADTAAFAETNLSLLSPTLPPDPVTTNYTGNWYATHYASFRIGNGARQDAEGLLRQSCNIAERAGFAAFNGNDQYGRSLADLRASNIAINKIEWYAGGQGTRWYYTSGGIGRPFWHPHKSFGSTLPGNRNLLGEIPNWQHNQTRSQNITNAVKNAVKAGSFGGIGFTGENRQGQNTYHGEIPYRVNLRINYSVTE